MITSTRPSRRRHPRAIWPLTPYGTVAVLVMTAGVAMVVIALWVS